MPRTFFFLLRALRALRGENILWLRPMAALRDRRTINYSHAKAQRRKDFGASVIPHRLRALRENTSVLFELSEVNNLGSAFAGRFPRRSRALGCGPGLRYAIGARLIILTQRRRDAEMPGRQSLGTGYLPGAALTCAL
jgi:hypothetical protein